MPIPATKPATFPPFDKVLVQDFHLSGEIANGKLGGGFTITLARYGTTVGGKDIAEPGSVRSLEIADAFAAEVESDETLKSIRDRFFALVAELNAYKKLV